MNQAMNIESMTKDRMGRQITSSIAMTVVLVAFSMLFASLLLGFTVFRITSPVWPPMGFERINLLLPTVSTILIVMSSFSYFRFQVAFLKNGQEKKIWFSLTAFLGLAFMVSQVMLWMNLHSKGIYIQDGIFPSIIYTFTWVHAAHVIVAWLVLFYLVPTLEDNLLIEKFEIRVFNVGKFWHFLGVVWLIMYVTIFIL